MADQVAGIASISVDGLFMDVASDLRYSMNTMSLEPLVGQSGPQGYKTSYVYGHITVTLRDTGGVSPSTFMNRTGVTVSAQLANGRTITAANAIVVNVQEVDTAESTYSVEFRSSNMVG